MGNILSSPQGIGGDDRCGVYALVKVHELSAVELGYSSRATKKSADFNYRTRA